MSIKEAVEYIKELEAQNLAEIIRESTGLELNNDEVREIKKNILDCTKATLDEYENEYFGNIENEKERKSKLYKFKVEKIMRNMGYNV